MDRNRDLHRMALIQSRSTSEHKASLDGRDLSRFQQSGPPRGHIVMVRSPLDRQKVREVFVDAWKPHEHPIVIGRADHAKDMAHDRGIASTCDHNRPVNLKQIGRLAFFAQDFYAIAARSPSDRGSIEPRSWLTLGGIVPRLPLSDRP